VEQTLTYTQPHAAHAVKASERLLVGLFLLVSTLLLFVDLEGPPPIALKDEARNANNALEMYLRGFGLVTTYEFRPDLWNTKPRL
jgi:hypothetical protein